MSWIVVCRVFFRSGTENLSSHDVKHPTRFYEGRVLDWGGVSRSVASPAGLPQIGDAAFRMADTDNHFRDLLETSSPPQSPLECLAELRLVQEGASEAAGYYIYAGEIYGFEFGDGDHLVKIRDITFSWLDDEWPGLLFAGQFLPTIFGRCLQDPSQDPHGLVPLPHIGYSLANGDRWGGSIGTMEDFTFVHRKVPSTGLWEVVDPAEYDITEDTADLGGVTYPASFVDFILEQEEGTEVRVDVDGYNTRPAFGALGSSASGLKRNPIDTFINMMDILQTKLGRTLDFDTTAILAIRTLFETVIDQVSPPLPYYCDAAITQPITFRALLGQFLASFNLDMFQNREGQISLSFINGPNVSRPEFTENFEIQPGSFRQFSPDPAINRIKYRFARNYAEERWGRELVHDNTADQQKLGTGSPLTPKIKPGEIEYWFTRDQYTAADVTARRAGFLTLRSYRQQFRMPLADAIPHADFELCGQVGITMRSGLAAGGYSNQEVRITALDMNLDDLSVLVSSNIYVDQEWQEPAEEVYEMEAVMSMNIFVEGEFTAT